MLCGVAVKRRHFLAYKARSQIDTRDHATKLSKIKFCSPGDQRLPISETSNSIRSIRPVNWVERKIFIFFRQDRRLPEISSSADDAVNVKRIPNRGQGPYRKKIKGGQFRVSESLKNPAVGTSGRFVDDPGRKSSEAHMSLLFAPSGRKTAVAANGCCSRRKSSCRQWRPTRRDSGTMPAAQKCEE